MRLWFTYFKEPLDTLDDDFDSVLPKLRSHFLESKWYVVYDFVEFVANNYEATGFKDGFTESCNRVLESEMSAYRFADGKIVQITDKSELEAIEDAISVSPGPVRTHLRRALELLSDRDNPDFRNSIKESISAIESLVASANGAPGTLGQLIKGLESEAPIHPALKSAFSNLYGYTSDQEGIRHAILESESIDFHDAKLMFVLCSAFVSFVTARISVDG